MNPYTVSAYLRAHPDPEPVFEVPAWQDDALCAETDPEAFVPEKGGSTREAKQVCRGCSVRAECLEYALDHDERFGIWGGFSERERRRLRHRFGRDIPAAVTSAIPSALQSREAVAA